MNINQTVFDMDTLIFEYAAGSLSETRELLVSTYMNFCDTTCDKVKTYETIGGQIMQDLCAPVAMSSQSLHNVLGKLDHQIPSAPVQLNTVSEPIPQVVLNKLQDKGKTLKWYPFYKGIKFCPIPTDDKNENAVLLKVDAGVKTPHHEHHGTEITLILDGAYHDGEAQYTKGDLIVETEDTHHEPVADAQTGCICLVINEGPVKFTTGMARFMNIFQR